MSEWSCRHQSGEGYCDRLGVGCMPGRVGCALRGKVRFTYDEEGNLTPSPDWGRKKRRRKRVKKEPV